MTICHWCYWGMIRQEWLREPNEIPRPGVSILAAAGEAGNDCCSWVAMLPCRGSRYPIHCGHVLVTETEGLPPCQAVGTHPASPGTAGTGLPSWTAACLVYSLSWFCCCAQSHCRDVQGRMSISY